MTSFFTSMQKRAQLFLALLFFLLSACASEGTPPSSETKKAPTGTAPQAIQVQQEPTYDGSYDPWTFTYASIETKIISIEQEKAFPDDTRSKSQWVLRFNIRESNPNKHKAYWSYYEVWHLEMLNGNTITPSNFKSEGHGVEINPGVTRDNWIDFPLDKKMDLRELKLIVGKPDEHQIETYLNSDTDLQKYRSKSIQPGNSTFTYSNGTWSVEKITSSLSINSELRGEQADKNMRYVIVLMKGTFKDNGVGLTVGNVKASQLGKTRIEIGSVSQELLGTPQPIVLETDKQAKTGTIIFQAPVSDGDNKTKMKMIFQADQIAGVSLGEVSISFEI